MEKRVNSKIETYIVSFKQNIAEKVKEMPFEDASMQKNLLEFVFDYDRLCLTKEDFIKRKRIKNAIPTSNRCGAKRANGEQCTRRRKDNCEFCGTHEKGRPHGLIYNGDENNQLDNNKNLEVRAQEIMGIVYYIDNYKNVYKTEDILSEKENPEIIAKYENTNGNYTIPLFGLV
tara:strand:- start:222 stop:743 length:522 start_codon:yes stop_codon:yes gene_type:complete